MLRIPVDKVTIIVQLARQALGRSGESLAEDEPAEGEPLPSSEDYDEQRTDALFDYVDALNGDELADLLALQWLGQGDIPVEAWEAAQREADEEVTDGDVVAELVSDPGLSDDLSAGLEALGYECPFD